MLWIGGGTASGGVLRLRLEGQLTCTDLPALEQECARHAEGGAQEVELSVGGLWSIDALACQALLRLPALGLRVRFLGPGPLVRQLLIAYGMGGWIVAGAGGRGRRRGPAR